MDRVHAAVQVLCALIANESIMSRLPRDGDGEPERLAAVAFAFVDAVEGAAYEYEGESVAEPAEAITEPEATETATTDDATEEEPAAE